MLTVGSCAAAGASSSSGSSMSPARRRFRSFWLIRWDSSPAALRVKVTPRISSGRASPLATSHATRSDMVVVLPEPAPATTSRGVNGDAITAACCSVGGKSPSASAISYGEYRTSCGERGWGAESCWVISL